MRNDRTPSAHFTSSRYVLLCHAIFNSVSHGLGRFCHDQNFRLLYWNWLLRVSASTTKSINILEYHQIKIQLRDMQKYVSLKRLLFEFWKILIVIFYYCLKIIYHIRCQKVVYHLHPSLPLFHLIKWSFFIVSFSRLASIQEYSFGAGTFVKKRTKKYSNLTGP